MISFVICIEYFQLMKTKTKTKNYKIFSEQIIDQMVFETSFICLVEMSNFYIRKENN